MTNGHPPPAAVNELIVRLKAWLSQAKANLPVHWDHENGLLTIGLGLGIRVDVAELKEVGGPDDAFGRVTERVQQWKLIWARESFLATTGEPLQSELIKYFGSPASRQTDFLDWYVTKYGRRRWQIPRCVACGSGMELGLLLDRGHGNQPYQGKWHRGVPYPSDGWFTDPDALDSMRMDPKRALDVFACRCPNCARLELVAFWT